MHHSGGLSDGDFTETNDSIEEYYILSNILVKSFNIKRVF